MCICRNSFHSLLRSFPYCFSKETNKKTFLGRLIMKAACGSGGAPVTGFFLKKKGSVYRDGKCETGVCTLQGKKRRGEKGTVPRCVL